MNTLIALRVAHVQQEGNLGSCR